MRLKLTLPSELKEAYHSTMYEPDENEPDEVSVNGRTSYLYEDTLDEDEGGINSYDNNIVNILKQASMSCWTHDFELELTVKNLGLNKDMKHLLVFNITEETPENYVCKALRAAFLPCEDYENDDVRQIAFSKQNEKLMDALKWLERTEKPDLYDVVSISEDINFGGQAKYLDENTISKMLGSVDIGASTSYAVRQALSQVADVSEKLYTIYDAFFLGFLHEYKADCGTFVDDDYGVKRHFGTSAETLQSLLDDFWELPVEKRYEYYYDGKTREQRSSRY